MPSPQATSFADDLAAIRTPSPAEDDFGADLAAVRNVPTVNRNTWDLRPDGTKKGDGYLGVLARADGRVASEFSIADSEDPRLKDPKGKYLDYPTLVPTLTKDEVQTVLNLNDGDEVPASIKKKAEAHALARIAKGEPVWAQPGEQQSDLYPELTRARVITEPLKASGVNGPATVTTPATPAPAQEPPMSVVDPDGALSFGGIAGQAPAAHGPVKTITGAVDLVGALNDLTKLNPGLEGKYQPPSQAQWDKAKSSTSDVIEGVFQTATPVVASALALNPVTTAIALGVAATADDVAQRAVKAAGGDDESARLAGNVAALLAAGRGTDVIIKQARADLKLVGIKARVAGDAAAAARADAGTIQPLPSDITVTPARTQIPARAEPNPIEGQSAAPVPPPADTFGQDLAAVRGEQTPAAPVEPVRPPTVLSPTVAAGTAAQVPEQPGAEVIDVTPPKAEREEHSFSSTQVNLPSDTAKKVLDLANAIPDKDLAEDGRAGDTEATAPHVTLKYGLHTTDVEKVREVLSDEPPITVTLGKTSYFPNGESGSGDVLKVDVDSPDLHRLNAKVAEALEHTDTHPNYTPHVTIAYLKPGLGKQYEGDESLKGHTVTLDAVRFSTKDGKIFEIPLNGAASSTPNSKLPSPKLTARRYQLPDPAAAVQERAATALEADVDGFADRYRARFGNVLNADNASELFDEYSESPKSRATMVRAVRGPAGSLVDEVYRRALAEPVPEGKERAVVFSSGGNGAGKSTVAQRSEPAAAIVFDSTLSLFEPSKAKIQQALDAGFKVLVAHVNRDPVAALVHGTLPRAMDAAAGNGRTVDLSAHARTHIEAPKIFLELERAYRDNPSVKFIAYKAVEGHDPKTLRLNALRVRKYPDRDALLGRLRDALDAEHAAGRISDDVYEGTRGTAVEAGGSRSLRPADAQPAGQTSPEQEVAAPAPVVDVLPTGEEQPRLPGGAGAVRDANVKTPQIDAPFSLSGGVSERPTGQQGGLLDSVQPEAQTSSRESVEQSAGAEPGEAGGAADSGVPPSYPGSARESARQREARRVAHYDEVFPHVLAAAQAVDPAVDPVHLRAEFDDRVNFLEDQQREYQTSGHDPRDLLRAIAKYGGLAPEGKGGLGGELRWLKEGNRGGAAAGVANVFRSKRQLDDRGVPVKGLPFDVMVQRLQQDPRFAWVENTDMLIDAIDDAIRHPATVDTFPGTAELAKVLGMDRGQVWWREKPTGDVGDASDDGLEGGDTSFNPEDFEGGGTGGAASMGGYASADQVTTAPIPPKADSRLFPPPPAPGAAAGGSARPVEFPELVDLARELQGVPKVVKRFRNAGWRGVFRGALGIQLHGDLFKPGQEYQLAATLAHEIGHLVDWLPDQTLKRGNLLGRLRSLTGFLKHTFTGVDGITVKNADVRRELVALSAEWRPWNPETASASFKAYRNSGKELYADAISVLLNNPGMLAAKAPTFYKQFFAELGAKPEVERAYFDLQEVLSGTPEELVTRRRAGVRRMFEEGDVSALELEQRKRNEAAARGKDLWFRLKTQLVDKNYAVIDRVRAAQKRGEVIPDDLNPVYFLEERNYIGGQLKGFTERNFLPVFNTIRDADIHWNAFGEALFYERIIAGDRSEVANPRGLSPTVAGELYESLKTELGPEKATVVRRAITEFRKAVREVAEQAHEAGLYTDELYDQMVKNPAYVTFQVVDHLESGVTSRVYKSIGTLKDIVNPADSTILKTLVTLRAIEHQKVKRAVLDFLTTHFPDDIADAKTVFSGKGHRPIESKDRDQHLVTYYVKGQLQGKYVDEHIANSLNNESIGHNNAVVSILKRINSGFFRPVFTTFNLGFQSFNFARDFTRFWKNTPGMTMARALRLYWKALPLARVRAFGMGDAPTAAQRQAYLDLITAEESKMLSVSFNDLISGREVEDTQVEDILARTGVGGIGKQSRLWYTKPFLAALDLIREVGDFIETLPKAAGIYEYRGKGTIAGIPASTRSFIRRKVGSPDFLARGTYTPLTNEIFLFSNAAAQAIRSDYEVAVTDPKTRSGWWWKTAKATLLPKVLMMAALVGLFGDEMRRLLSRATEYDRTNYTVLPLGEDGHGNAVYLRMPQDQTGQLVGGVFWKSLELFRDHAEVLKTLSQVADYMGGQIPSVSPSVSAIGAGYDYLAGQNPYDKFRGRNVFTDDEWKARDSRTFRKFVGWEFQQLGGGILWKFYPGEERPRTETAGQRILELPIVSNLIGRFIRITDYGATEQLRTAAGEADSGEAGRRLSERESVDRAISDYLALPNKDQTAQTREATARRVTESLYGADRAKVADHLPEIRIKVRVGALRGSADPLVDAVLSSSSNATKLAILQEGAEQMGDSAFDTWLQMAVRERVISKNVYAAVRRSRARDAPAPQTGAMSVK